MTKDKLPTAEECYKYHFAGNYRDFDKTLLKGKDVKEVMIEFAKIHVKAALEAANQRYNLSNYYQLKHGSLLKSYSLVNIK